MFDGFQSIVSNTNSKKFTDFTLVIFTQKHPICQNANFFLLWYILLPYCTLCEYCISLWRGSAPPPPNGLGCVSLFLDLLTALLSCQVTGLSAVDNEDDTETRQLLTLTLPKPLLKMIVMHEDGHNLLTQLKQDIQVYMFFSSCIFLLELFTEF